jgi:hypothetical protein
MPDPWRKVIPGEEVQFSASAWNAMLAAAAAEQQRRHSKRVEEQDQRRDGDIVRVWNATNQTLPARAVLGLAGPIFRPSDSVEAFLREVAFRGVVPEASHAGRFCVTLEPARPGQVVRAFLDGVTHARVEVLDPAHICADAEPGNTINLVTSESGSAQILMIEDAPYGGGKSWAVVRLGGRCGKARRRRPARCDCPDGEGLVLTDCAGCIRMPRVWWLTILSANTNPYASGYCDLGCEQLAGVRVKLTNEADPYYDDASCTWSGHGPKCFFAELTLDDDEWKLTILDRDGCILAILRKPAGEFDCCGPNLGWALDPASACEVDITLTPDPCTCCPDPTCPPEGQVTCTEVDCCFERIAGRGGPPCVLIASVNGLANHPIPGQGQFPDPDKRCNCMNGIYHMGWIKNCTWEGVMNAENSIGECQGTSPPIPLATPVRTRATLVMSGRTLTLTLRGDSGQLAVFQTTEWDCSPSAFLEYVGGTCVDPGYPGAIAEITMP